MFHWDISVAFTNAKSEEETYDFGNLKYVTRASVPRGTRASVPRAREVHLHD